LGERVAGIINSIATEGIRAGLSRGRQEQRNKRAEKQDGSIGFTHDD